MKSGAARSAPQPLRIAQVAPLWTRVPPTEYGGAELMVHWLTEDLVRRGHDVTLFASGDSETSARLVATCNVNLIEAMEAGKAYDYDYYAVSAIVEAIGRSPSFDIVHSHIGAIGIPFSALSTVPVVHTVHAGLDGVDEHWILDRYSNAVIASISHSQVSSVPASRRTNIQTIYHGCDFAEYEFSGSEGSYLAFIGRMGPHKNPVGAIEIARQVGMPIVLAGQPQDRSERRYFESEVRPLIGGGSVEYLGPISAADKVRLLRGAAALLFPIRWEEHFGLVMIEAMACGTPVVANKRGSVPEVVDAGVTGYYTEREADLPDLVRKAARLDRREIRKHAEARFSRQRMTDDYVALYERLIRRSGHPSAGGSESCS